MGGGGVIKSAAKAAAYGVFRSPVLDEAGRRASRQQVAAFQSAAPTVESGYLLYAEKEQNNSPAIVAVSHWPEWIDDWKVTGGKEEDLGAVDIAPRQVFGPIPSLEEAKSATADLKDALKKVYFEPNLKLKSQKDSSSSASGEISTVSAVPKHVSQMFSLLQGSSEVQDVVASLACDKKVWDAVMKNEKVMEFCKNPAPIPTQVNIDSPESIVGNDSPHEDAEETSEVSGFTSFVNKIKDSVSEMVRNITNFIQDFFQFSLKDPSSSSTGQDFTDMAVGGFLALAVAAILIVLLKRG